MHTYLLVLLAIVLVFVFMTQKKESFTQEDTSLALEILDFFNRPVHPFGDYLELLVKNNNTSDNLISKGLYNKFKKNKLLTVSEIVNSM